MMKRHMLGSAVVASALLLTGCQAGDDATDYDAVGQDEKTAGSEEDTDETGHAQELAAAQPRIVTTYDGGILTLDATTLDVIDDTKLEGFNRLNPVGDGRHLMVSVAEGFRLFDAGVWTQPHGDHTHSYAADPQLTDTVFDTELPGHVVNHGETTVLFGDGDGKIQTFDTDDFSDGDPQPEVTEAAEPHHGVAVKLADGSMLRTVGTEDERSGAQVVDDSGKEIAPSTTAPESTAKPPRRTRSSRSAARTESCCTRTGSSRRSTPPTPSDASATRPEARNRSTSSATTRSTRMPSANAPNA